MRGRDEVVDAAGTVSFAGRSSSAPSSGTVDCGFEAEGGFCCAGSDDDED